MQRRLRRSQSQLQDADAGGPQRGDADPSLRIRRDPDASCREVRRVPADGADGAGRDAILAVLADGLGALPWRRLRPFLRLCADQARIPDQPLRHGGEAPGSEEHTSELQSLMRISYAVFCLKKKKYTHN